MPSIKIIDDEGNVQATIGIDISIDGQDGLPDGDPIFDGRAVISGEGTARDAMADEIADALFNIRQNEINRLAREAVRLVAGKLIDAFA